MPEDPFLLGWAGRRWRPAGVKQVVAVKLVQPRKESRSVTGVTHQVSKKTATRRLKAPDAPRQVPAPQSAAEAVLLQVDPGTPGRNAPPAINGNEPTGPTRRVPLLVVRCSCERPGGRSQQPLPPGITYLGSHDPTRPAPHHPAATLNSKPSRSGPGRWCASPFPCREHPALRITTATCGVLASMTTKPRFPRVVDDITVRLIAFVVLVLAIAALALHQWWIYAVLAVDFLLRTTFGPKASPVARGVQRFVRPRVSALKRPTAGPPKRFAAGIGAALTSVAAALWVLGVASPVVMTIGVVMVVFPALESILGLCVGCKAFGVLMKLGVVPEEICLECADISLRRRNVADPA